MKYQNNYEPTPEEIAAGFFFIFAYYEKSSMDRAIL
jgi:hypothetical protein